MDDYIGFKMCVFFCFLCVQSMFEVIASERSYLRSLLVLIEHFMESSDLSNTLIIMDKKTLFSNILRIKEVSEK